MESTTLFILIFFLLYIDVMAIYYAHKSDMYERSQLIIQALIVVLIPFIGGILVLMFALSQINKQLVIKPQEQSKAKILHYLFLSFILVNNSNSQDYGASEFSGDYSGSNGGSGD